MLKLNFVKNRILSLLRSTCETLDGPLQKTAWSVDIEMSMSNVLKFTINGWYIFGNSDQIHKEKFHFR